MLLVLCSAVAVLASVAGDPARSQDRQPAKSVSEALDCTAPKEVTRFRQSLPNTARAVRRQEILTIVAIGSSSTQGVGASEKGNGYPAQLAAALQRQWPDMRIRVINKGVGGEDAQQMLRRFETDVLPHQPHLVIWQVGSNYTLRYRDMENYERILRAGINRLKTAGTDVILMDLQYAPRVIDKPLHRRVVTKMGELSNDLKVAVFRRFAIMRHWVTSGRYEFRDIVAKDRLHMNDASYGCIGKLLAASVTAAARSVQPTPDTADR
jgi:acyl-CoA thioesterase-1